MTDDEFDPLPADMMRVRREPCRSCIDAETRPHRHQPPHGPFQPEPYPEGIPMTGPESLAQLQRDLDDIDRNKAAEARIGAGNMRRRAWADALIDPTNGSGLILRLAIERFAPSHGHWTKTWGMGSPPTEAESRAMHGDR